MKIMLNRILTHPRYTRAFEWGRLISITGFSQAIIQTLALLSGLIIIRLLPTDEYALYTLANTMLGTLTVLADGGISVGVMAQGGKVWQNHKQLGAVLATGLKLRKKFAVISLLITSPILLYLLLHHGASWITSILIIGSLVPAFFASLSDTLLEIAPKLRQDIFSLQQNQVGTSIGRLTLIALTVFFFPWAFIAILGGGLPRIWANIRLRKISRQYADLSQLPEKGIKKDILTTVRKIFPGAVYFCISSQITLWLISIFGNTTSIAQMGALSRLTMILSVFGVVIQTLVIPRFARLESNKKVLLKRFVVIQCVLFLFAIFIIGIVSLFPNWLLWILGPNYSDINNLIVLAFTAAIGSMILGTLYSTMNSRGWIMPPVLSISIGIVSQIVIISLVDFSTIKGIYHFSIVHTLTGLLTSYLFVAITLHHKKNP